MSRPFFTHMKVASLASLATLAFSLVFWSGSAWAQNPFGALQGLINSAQQGINQIKPGQAPAQPNTQNPLPAQVNPMDLVNNLQQAFVDIDVPKEVQIGHQLSSILLGAKPLHPNMALQRYVNRLGRWIALQSARPDLPWTFAVVDDPGYNAFAAPGGYVFVTKGLVDRMRDESELAGVLGHEISHVVEKHHLKALQKSAKTGLLTQALASQLKNNAAGNISARLLALGRDVYSKGLDKEDELAADRAGVVLATRSGFDPYGLVSVLEDLRGALPEDPLYTLTMSTHPAAQMRLDQLELAMQRRMDIYTGSPGTTIAQRLAKGN